MTKRGALVLFTWLALEFGGFACQLAVDFGFLGPTTIVGSLFASHFWRNFFYVVPIFIFLAVLILFPKIFFGKEER